MKNLVFLTGAGMSVESGFKTFRGNDGLWENYPVEQVATHEGWLADPDLVTRFYNMLRTKLYAAQPNEGHKLIKALEKELDVQKKDLAKVVKKEISTLEDVTATMKQLSK